MSGIEKPIDGRTKEGKALKAALADVKAEQTSEPTEDVIEYTPTPKKKRMPIHQHRDILAVPNMPADKKARWVLDRENRLQIFQDAGYQFVDQEDVEVGDRKVEGSREVGDVVCIRGTDDGCRLYLMAIDRELFDSDQLAKSEKLDAVDQELQANVLKKDAVH